MTVTAVMVVIMPVMFLKNCKNSTFLLYLTLFMILCNPHDIRKPLRGISELPFLNFIFCRGDHVFMLQCDYTPNTSCGHSHYKLWSGPLTTGCDHPNKVTPYFVVANYDPYYIIFHMIPLYFYRIMMK